MYVLARFNKLFKCLSFLFSLCGASIVFSPYTIASDNIRLGRFSVIFQARRVLVLDFPLGITAVGLSVIEPVLWLSFFAGSLV